MKYYEKQYENFLRRPERVEKLKFEKLSNGIGLTNTQYIEAIRNGAREFYDTYYRALIRAYWIRGQMIYNGRMYGFGKNVDCFFARIAFAVLTQNFASTNYSLITEPVSMLTRVTSYFEDFYPDFFRYNPDTNPDYYKFPYKNITIPYLIFVYQMPERLEFLKMADEKNMAYDEFVDYLMNYVYCYNEETGREVYRYNADRNGRSYMQYREGPLYEIKTHHIREMKIRIQQAKHLSANHASSSAKGNTRPKRTKKNDRRKNRKGRVSNTRQARNEKGIPSSVSGSVTDVGLYSGVNKEDCGGSMC